MGERTILIADDAAMFRELGALFLARSGRVLTANNGYEALDVARREHPAVVVADLDMPCLGGDGLCLRLREDESLAGTPVILVVSIGVVVGMWLERLIIVVPSLSVPFVDFPSHPYWPSLTEISIFAAAVAAFCLGFMIFAKFQNIF